MDYQHLTTFERGRIEALHSLGYTVREIGQQMNRHICANKMAVPIFFYKMLEIFISLRRKRLRQRLTVQAFESFLR
jgi:hypothetical protein